MIAAMKAAGRRVLVQFHGAMIALFLIIAALAVADEVEGRLWPVLRSQVTEAEPHTDPAQVCWHWSFVKVRDAQPISFSWTMERGNHRYSIIPTPAQGEVPTAFRNLPRGQIADRFFCAPAPRQNTARPTVITGYAIYRTHGFWSVRQEFAPVVIP